MFCSSLRKRREWTKIPNILLEAKSPKWKEIGPEVFDIALPFQLISCNRDSPDYFRFILLSSRDLETSTDKISRVQRLFHAYGGRYVGIILLVNQQLPEEEGCGVLMALQTSLLPDYIMPILPIHSIDSFEDTLLAFQRQIYQPSSSIDENLSVISLLPFCSISPPIPEHALYILSDICPNIPGLQALVSTQEGMQKLAHFLSDYPQVVQDIFNFWHVEYIAD